MPHQGIQFHCPVTKTAGIGNEHLAKSAPNSQFSGLWSDKHSIHFARCFINTFEHDDADWTFFIVGK